MCAEEENSTDKKTYRHSTDGAETAPIKALFSSRGFALVTDKQQDLLLIKALAGFVCGFCEYPVMGSWHFCPMCGGILEWKALQ